MQHQRKSERGKTSVPRTCFEKRPPISSEKSLRGTNKRLVKYLQRKTKGFMKKDMDAKGLREEDAANRNRWRQLTRLSDPTILWD